MPHEQRCMFWLLSIFSLNWSTDSNAEDTGYMIYCYASQSTLCTYYFQLPTMFWEGLFLWSTVNITPAVWNQQGSHSRHWKASPESAGVLDKITETSRTLSEQSRVPNDQLPLPPSFFFFLFFLIYLLPTSPYPSALPSPFLFTSTWLGQGAAPSCRRGVS